MVLSLYYSSSKCLSHNAKVLAIYSRNPFFAGDVVSALITFEHLDPEREPEPKTEQENEQNNDGGEASGEGSGDGQNRGLVDDKATEDQQEQSWSRRISSQFSRSLFLSQLEEAERREEAHKQAKDSAETFLSGSAQLFGYFAVEPELVDLAQFAKLRQEAVVSGCVAGVPSLKVSNHAPKSFFQSLSSNLSSFLAAEVSDFDGVLHHSFRSDPKSVLLNIQPVFATNQLLMFPVLTLRKGQFKQFYLQFRLPGTLPPTYHSSTISITYQLIINTERLRSQGQTPTNINVTFPLKVRVAPRPNGLQTVPSLQREFLQNKRYFNSKHSGKSNFLVELEADDEAHRDFSFLQNLGGAKADNIETITEVAESGHDQEEQDEDEDEDVVNDIASLKAEFINTMKTLVNKKSLITTEQIKSLPSTPRLNSYMHNNSSSTFNDSRKSSQVRLGNGDSVNPFDDYLKSSGETQYEDLDGRAKIQRFVHAAYNNELHQDLADLSLLPSFEPVIKESLKTQFLVKFKNKFATRLVFDKPFYKVGDTVSLSFDFTDSGKDSSAADPAPSFRVSGISVSLQSHEKFKYEYLTEYRSVIEDIHKQFQDNPRQAQKDWKFPQVDPHIGGLSYEEINRNEHIEREIHRNSPNYWKPFTQTHWTKKYSLLASNFKRFNVNDLLLGYGLCPQFSTDVFALRYFLVFKFILVDEHRNANKSSKRAAQEGDTTALQNVYLKSVHHDTNGTVYCAKDTLVGTEFSIKLPFNIIASENDFNNINI